MIRFRGLENICAALVVCCGQIPYLDVWGRDFLTGIQNCKREVKQSLIANFQRDLHWNLMLVFYQLLCSVPEVAVISEL